ncbi:MAG: S1C family serine protease [Bacteroidia bacterium]
MIGRIIILAGIALFVAGCATLVTSSKQRVSIEVARDSSGIFVSDGYREHIKIHQSTLGQKIEKIGVRQVRIESVNCKNEYVVLLPYKRKTLFWIMQPLNIFNVGFGCAMDFHYPKNIAYQKYLKISMTRTELVYREPESDRFIELGSFSFEFAERELDNLRIPLKYSIDSVELANRMKDAEEEVIKKIQDRRGVVSKKRLNDEYQALTQVMIENSRKEEVKNLIMDNLFSLMLRTRYADTSELLNMNFNNSVVLEPVIRKMKTYEMKGIRENSFYRVQVTVDWNVRSTFGSLLETFSLVSESGDFTKASNEPVMDALGNGYLQLLRNPQFKKRIERQKLTDINELPLFLNQPESPIVEKREVPKASVIVKTSMGHGSGFVISNDGYVISNYHVIAGRDSNFDKSIEVVDGYGNRYPAKVVRVNMLRDLALLKIDQNMPKAFVVPRDSSYTFMQKVYTIGAPRSVELGQSLTQGVVSGVKGFKEIQLIELNMSVNSGNSGGPVFDNQGNLHGVVVSKMVGKDIEGIAFAIPAHKIMEYLNISYQ